MTSSGALQACVAASHVAPQSFTVLSSLPLASISPCGSNATLLTVPWCPSSVRSSFAPGGRSVCTSSSARRPSSLSFFSPYGSKPLTPHTAAVQERLTSLRSWPNRRICRELPSHMRQADPSASAALAGLQACNTIAWVRGRDATTSGRRFLRTSLIHQSQLLSRAVCAWTTSAACHC